MPAYDIGFNPPAPVADVTVAYPVTGISSGTLRGKLDSGAEVTVLPARLVALLNITPRGHIWTRGYAGTYARRLVYYVRFTVEGFTVPSVRCIATDRTTILLGRNVLNRFIVTLDGKSLGEGVGERQGSSLVQSAELVRRRPVWKSAGEVSARRNLDPNLPRCQRAHCGYSGLADSY